MATIIIMPLAGAELHLEEAETILRQSRFWDRIHPAEQGQQLFYLASILAGNVPEAIKEARR